MADFVHLHVHTEYSLLDGLSKITELLGFVKENGMDSLAITDHGVLYGAIEFYKKALKEGVKPIIGMEGYTTNLDHKLRVERKKIQNYHILLLAKTQQGYENLMKLTSVAHLEGYYYRPRVDRATLAKYSRGLICTSACAQGEVAQALINADFEKAKEIASWFSQVFGDDYYLEMQRHEYEKFLPGLENEELKTAVSEMAENEKKINEGVVKISRSLGIPLVATNDAHYIRKEDAKAQDSLVCIATGKNVSDVKRLRFIDYPTFYIRTPSEMKSLFADYPEALKNTLKIADKTSVKLTLNKWYFPQFPTPKDVNLELTNLARAGFKEKFKKNPEEAKQRLNYELKTIIDKGYSTYFLIVSDFAKWAKENGIVTNTRGSTAGCLVAYCLGITDLDPLKYDLPFERFLTPWRPSPPDVDFDVADDRREELIEYIVEKYGKDKVAQICTFGRMLSRSAVRDIARVLGFPYATGDRIAKLIPPPRQGFPVFIDKAIEETAELADLYKRDEEAKIVLDLARQVEGNARHISVHAAGVVIAPSSLTDFTPLQLDPEGKKVITQYDMDALDPNVSPGEAVGLLKFDLLGLRNLSILGSSIKIVKETRGLEIDLHLIPLDDKKTFAMLSEGFTMGVFQLGGAGMTRYLKELKATRVEDLMAMVALYRPGPIALIPEYIERKNNPSKVKYPDPRMKDYLTRSYGLLVYQDDVLLTAINIAGYSWEEADKFRKAVGKKIPSEMEKQKDKFIKGAVEHGMSKEGATSLFSLIEPFAAYGFNKAHAASYGMLAYQTAYMKANYPVEFMTAYLTHESQDKEKVALAVSEAKRMKISVLAPDVNLSGVDFSLEKDKKSLSGRAIRFGLSAIKNVGRAGIEAILSARVQAGFKNIQDFCSRVDSRKVNKKVLESLIKAGALDRFGSRARLLIVLEDIRAKSGKSKLNLDSQPGLFAEEDIVAKAAIDIPEVSEFTPEELRSLEMELLGFSLTFDPLSKYLDEIASQVSHRIFEIDPEVHLGTKVKIGGVITKSKVVLTKTSGAEMAFLRIEDGTGSIEVVIFPKIFAKFRSALAENKPIIVVGRVDTRGETISVVVDEIYEVGSVTIKIPKTAEKEALGSLKEVLQKNPGDRKVFLVFEDSGATSTIGLPFRVKWSDGLSSKIKQILSN